jgi:hypothetical protein
VAKQKRAKGHGRPRGQSHLSVQSSIGATDIMWRIRSALKLGDMGAGRGVRVGVSCGVHEFWERGRWPEERECA